jgi:four helix bundle protein
MEQKPKITSYRDLQVYQSTYKAAIIVIKQILPKLPPEERYDLVDQLRRSVKTIPRLIAEGYGKKDQKAGFQKYLDDAMTECNETVVGLSQCRDLYSPPVDGKICDEMINLYDKAGRQLYNLKAAWNRFKRTMNNDRC